MTPSSDHGFRVLVADDDASIRQLVCTIVKREGFEVDSAADGMEALALLHQKPYAVILLDLMMPRMDGFGVIAGLKENPPAIKPIVLVISAYADQQFREVDAGIVAGVLRKPFEVDTLGGIVRNCVEGFIEAVGKPRAYYDTDSALRDFEA
jgi:Response regulator containing CheY-like receiver, AAA-type ATPase, and DNA-binding domains